MQVPVLIEQVVGNGYRARAGAPFDWSAEGATPDEALRALNDVVSRQVAAGARIAAIEIPGKGHALLAYAGTWKDHPLLDDWRQAIAEYRQAAEEDTESRADTSPNAGAE